MLTHLWSTTVTLREWRSFTTLISNVQSNSGGVLRRRADKRVRQVTG